MNRSREPVRISACYICLRSHDPRTRHGAAVVDWNYDVACAICGEKPTFEVRQRHTWP